MVWPVYITLAIKKDSLFDLGCPIRGPNYTKLLKTSSIACSVVNKVTLGN